MANQQQLSLLVNNIDAWNQWRKHNPQIIPDLQGANLSNVNLRGANLANVNLEKAVFYGADLSGAWLVEANLRRSDFTSAICFETIFNSAELSHAYLTHADCSRASLINANLKNVYLIEAYLVEAKLKNANLEAADLSNAYLTGADLTGANLQKTNFSGADLTETKGLTSTDQNNRWTNENNLDIEGKNNTFNVDQAANERDSINRGYKGKKILPIQTTQSQPIKQSGYHELMIEIETLRLENTRLKVQVYELYEEKKELIKQMANLKENNSVFL